MELDPRIMTLGGALGFPESLEMITPGAFPCIKSPTSLEVTPVNCSPDTTETALDNSDCFFSLYPTTMTSSRLRASSSNDTSMTVRPLRDSSMVTKPMRSEEHTSELQSRENLV